VPVVSVLHHIHDWVYVVAGYVVLLYDHLLTLNDEVSIVRVGAWRRTNMFIDRAHMVATWQCGFDYLPLGERVLLFFHGLRLRHCWQNRYLVSICI
jgi:glucose dehydrogenase